MVVSINNNNKTIVVTGSAGFIGFHVSHRLLKENWNVIGIDSMSDYYDISLKQSREKILLEYKNYRSIHEKIEKPNMLSSLFAKERPNIIIHLAAQAGVRYSFENPRSYLESNVLGTFELLEALKKYPPNHFLLASTSSIYGANKKMPFKETDKADHQLSFYAATKKSTEVISHTYSHLYNIPTTAFRFFTVYGPWGRPDMALFKFTKAILNNHEIDVFNNGFMKRDFTYIDDLVESITRLINFPPNLIMSKNGNNSKNDSKSFVAPFRIVNIGNSKTVKLIQFINIIEKILGVKARKKLLPMQSGDVLNTWSNSSLLKNIIDYSPTTSLEEGVKQFIDWYKKYYKIS